MRKAVVLVTPGDADAALTGRISTVSKAPAGVMEKLASPPSAWQPGMMTGEPTVVAPFKKVNWTFSVYVVPAFEYVPKSFNVMAKNDPLSTNWTLIHSPPALFRRLPPLPTTPIP